MWLPLQNLLRREPLKLVDGGQSQRTFVYIKDAIEAVLLMIVCCSFDYVIYCLLLVHLNVTKWYGLLQLRKTQRGLMVIFLMWATPIMKLQSDSSLK